MHCRGTERNRSARAFNRWPLPLCTPRWSTVRSRSLYTYTRSLSLSLPSLPHLCDFPSPAFINPFCRLNLINFAWRELSLSSERNFVYLSLNFINHFIPFKLPEKYVITGTNTNLERFNRRSLRSKFINGDIVWKDRKFASRSKKLITTHRS